MVKFQNNVGVRFIEYFSTNRDSKTLNFIPNIYVRKEIEKRFGTLEPMALTGSGPVLNYRIRGMKGYTGFISYHTQNFCERCNRVRLKCNGRLYPCLFSSYSLGLKKLLREDIDLRR